MMCAVYAALRLNTSVYLICVTCNHKELTMKVTLNKFTHMWDEASLETLDSEFNMMELILAQPITSANGSSILDYLVFDDTMEVEVPEQITDEVHYFKAPWDD